MIAQPEVDHVVGALRVLVHQERARRLDHRLGVDPVIGEVHRVPAIGGVAPVPARGRRRGRIRDRRSPSAKDLACAARQPAIEQAQQAQAGQLTAQSAA